MPGTYHRAAERYGAEKEQLENIWDYKTNSAFSDAERAALDLALAASVIPNTVDDIIAENVRKYWDEGEIVEMMGVIALFGYLNRWNDSMGTEMEDWCHRIWRKIPGERRMECGKHQY